MIGDPRCPKCGSLVHSYCNDGQRPRIAPVFPLQLTPTFPLSTCGRCGEARLTDSLGFCCRCSAALSMDAPDGPFSDPSPEELEAAKVSILGMRPVNNPGTEWVFNDGVIYTALARFIRARKAKFR